MAKTPEELAKRLAEIRQKIFLESQATWRAQARRDYWKRVKRALLEEIGHANAGQMELEIDERTKGNVGEVPQSEEADCARLQAKDRMPNG